MEITRPRESKQFIVKSNQNIITKLLCFIFTSIMWIYSLIIFYLFFCGALNLNNNFISIIKSGLKVNNSDIQRFIIISFFIFITVFVILLFWRTYNKKKYGKLNRRHTPKKVSKEEVFELGLVSREDFELLTSEKVIVFYKNPMKELGEA